MTYCVFTKTVSGFKWYLIIKRYGPYPTKEDRNLKELNPQTTVKCTESQYNPIQFL